MNIIIGIIGLCAAALLGYYVYILMKNECGDSVHIVSCRSDRSGNSARSVHQKSYGR